MTQIQELGWSAVQVSYKKSHEGIKTLSKSKGSQEEQRKPGGAKRMEQMNRVERTMVLFVMLISHWLSSAFLDLWET